MKRTRCSTCNAYITWASINGKDVPLNWRRQRAYLERGDEIVELSHLDLGGGKPSADWEELSKPVLVRASHFLTCPDAARHSRG